MDSQVSISRLCFLFCLYLSLVTAALHVDNPDKVHVPVNNYYLYQLVKTVDPLAEKNIESMIREIFNQNGITFEKVHTDPLMKTLTFKVKFLCHKVKKCKGGRQLKKLLAKLKSSTYDLKFTYKTDTPRKRKLQEDFAEERKRRKLLEDELETANTVVKDLVKATSILQSELGTDGNKKRSRGKTKDKRKYSACQKRRHKKKEINRAKNVVEALRPNGMSPVLIIFKDEHSKEVQLSFENREGKGRCETDRAVYLIDKFNISRRAYHELAQSCDSLPTQNLVSNRIKDLNAQFNVQAVSGSFTGVYQSIEERLTVKLRQMSASKQDEDILQDGRIKVKISGDGTRIGKRIHVLNFVFSIIGERACSGVTGSYLIGIVKVPEKYDCLKEGLGDIISEINNLQEVNVDGHIYRVDFFLGGDLKFLNLVMGIDGFGSAFSCLWCKCPAKERFDTGKQWSMTDATLGARSIEEIVKCSKLKQKSVQFSCSHAPLFPNIPITHVVPDTLHLFLRVADQLVSHLLTELRKRDNLSVSSTLYAPEKCANMRRFENFVQKLNIEWQFYVNKESKRVSSRDFTGPEHWKIFNNIDLAEMIPGHPKLELITSLWTRFVTIVTMLKDKIPKDEIPAFRETTKDWLNTFNLVYITTNVTPYMHVLVYHVNESLELHGNLSHFSQQGLEKLNDRVTGWYFRSSNHKGVEALKQIMLKQNRLELLEEKHQRGLKFHITCTKCKKVGHNRRTCFEE